jgi:hypothetical protein
LFFGVFAQWGLFGAGTYVTPSLNHAGCVITTSGVFFFFAFFMGGGYYVNILT